MLWLIVGLVLFLGIHSVRIVAPEFRENFIATRGEKPWKGIYSVLSIIAFVILVWGFGQARGTTPQLWVPPFWMSHVTGLLMAIAFIVAVAANLPAGMIKRAVKHPTLVSVKIWAFAHLLANGDLASVVLFGAFLAWAVVDRISCKKRGDPVFADVSVKWDIIAFVVGIALYLGFLLFAHEWLIGVQPVAFG